LPFYAKYDKIVVMKNTDEKDIEEMYIEELKAYAVAMRTRAESEKKRADDVTAALNRLLSEFADKETIIKRYNMERFFSKADNAYERSARHSHDAEARSRKGKAGRPRGSRNYDYSKDELEKLSEGNEPITYDALMSLPEEQREGFVRVSDTIGYQLEIIQKRIIVRKVVNITYKKDGDTGTEFLREPSHLPIRGCIAAPSLLSDVLFMKYGFGVPHYRYVGWLETQPIPISSQLLYDWTAGACNAMMPAYDAIKDSFRHADVVHIDETPVRTIDAEDRINGYIFVFSAEIDGTRRRLYHFSQDRTTGIVREVLGDDYHGLIVVDGYDGYDCFADLGMKIQRCLVHAVRKFKEILKGTPRDKQKKHPANRVIRLFGEIFTDEEVIKQMKPKTPEERLALRNAPGRTAHVKALIEALESISKDYAEGSNMKKAADYFLRDRDSFLLFTRDGRAPLDNSEAERTVKPYALARRNFLFVRGKNGGDCSAIAMTMIQNAYINDIEPMSYLELLMTDAYKDNSVDLPWLPTTKDRIAVLISSKAERK
jgi:transposase